jgi:hypothetical protein
MALIDIEMKEESNSRDTWKKWKHRKILRKILNDDFLYHIKAHNKMNEETEQTWPVIEDAPPIKW